MNTISQETTAKILTQSEAIPSLIARQLEASHAQNQGLLQDQEELKQAQDSASNSRDQDLSQGKEELQQSEHPRSILGDEEIPEGLEGERALPDVQANFDHHDAYMRARSLTIDYFETHFTFQQLKNEVLNFYSQNNRISVQKIAETLAEAALENACLYPPFVELVNEVVRVIDQTRPSEPSCLPQMKTFFESLAFRQLKACFWNPARFHLTEIHNAPKRKR